MIVKLCVTYDLTSFRVEGVDLSTIKEIFQFETQQETDIEFTHKDFLQLTNDEYKEGYFFFLDAETNKTIDGHEFVYPINDKRSYTFYKSKKIETKENNQA